MKRFRDNEITSYRTLLLPTMRSRDEVRDDQLKPHALHSQEMLLKNDHEVTNSRLLFHQFRKSYEK